MPPIPSKETGDRKTRPTRFLLDFGGQEQLIPGGRSCSIHDDMTLVAWGQSTMMEVTGRHTAPAAAPESGFPLANTS